MILLERGRKKIQGRGQILLCHLILENRCSYININEIQSMSKLTFSGKCLISLGVVSSHSRMIFLLLDMFRLSGGMQSAMNRTPIIFMGWGFLRKLSCTIAYIFYMLYDISRLFLLLCYKASTICRPGAMLKESEYDMLNKLKQKYK